MYGRDSEEESLSSYDGNDLKAVETLVKALNPWVCCAFGNVYLSTWNTRKVIYGVSFFLHGKKILKIQLMIRLQILCTSWSSPSCKNCYCCPCAKFFYFHRLLIMIIYPCFLHRYPKKDIYGWCHHYVFCCTSLYSRILCRWKKQITLLFTDNIAAL